MNPMLYDDELARRFGTKKLQEFKLAQREARRRLTEEGYLVAEVYEAMMELIQFGVLTRCPSATYKVTKAILDGRVRIARRAS
jgi:hypothetical protein